MKVSEFAVKHPIIITMALIVLFVFGIVSINGMSIEFMADMNMPQAMVYCIYAGASAEDMEVEVTKVLEDNFVTLPHLKAIDSSSYNSVSFITITYADGIEPYDQLQELRNRIDNLIDDLPDGVSKPNAFVGGMSMMPVISFAVSAGHDMGRTTQYIKDELTPRLTRIDGVSSIEVDGGQELEVSIKLDTDALVAKGISVTTVYQILNYGNVNLPLGSAEHQRRTIQVRYAGSFNSIEDICNLPVGFSDNSVVRLSDVAEVSLNYPEEDIHVSDGRLPLLLVSVTKRSDGNTVKIIKEVKKVLADIEKETGGAISFHLVSDDSRQIMASMKTVITSGIMGIIFAVLVILLFMADWRTTLTIGLSIPLCILFSFIGLKLCNITINLMSLSGLVISLGMVVDGSTVMIDQVYRYYSQRNKETGLTLYTVNQSIFRGWDEVAGSIFASIATTLVVFIPMALMKGLIGNVLNAVSITIIMAISASLVVALIIVPYLLKLLLSDDGPTIRSRPRRFDVAMETLENGYRRILVWAVKHKGVIVGGAFGLLIFSGLITTKMGIAFIPSTDSGDFFLNAEFPTGTSLEQTVEKMELAQDLLYRYVPEIDNIVLYTGKSNTKGVISMSSTPQSAYAHVILVPVAERTRDVHEIMILMQDLWAAAIPDATISVQNGGFDKLVGYASGGGGYGLTLISEDLDLLYKTASDLRDFLADDPEVITATLDCDFDTSTMVIDMSQEYLSSLGLTSYQAGITSAILFQGMDCGRYREQGSGKRYNIRLSSNIAEGNISADDIANIHIITDSGQDVSFANLSDIYVETAVSQINHSNRAKTITVSGTLVSENTANVSRHVNEYLAKNPLPSGVESTAGGIMSMIGDMIPPMLGAMGIAVFLVYTVMVIQFEKFKQPLLIMASIPFCFIGVVSGLLMFGSTLNLLSLLGLVSLAGVVVNNGIILVDYINQLRVQRREAIARERGYQDRDGNWLVVLTPDEEENLLVECITDGSASRIKPILITTLTTLLGDIPMAVAKGEGAEIYAPMGQAIVGGLITSTLITLVLIPVLYYMSELREARDKEAIALAKAERAKKHAEMVFKLNTAAEFARAEYEADREARKKRKLERKSEKIKEKSDEE